MEMWESVMGTLDPHTPSLVVESGWAFGCVCCCSRRDPIPSFFAYHTNTFLKIKSLVYLGKRWRLKSEVLHVLVDMDIQFGVYEYLTISPKGMFPTLSSDFWGDS